MGKTQTSRHPAAQLALWSNSLDIEADLIPSEPTQIAQAVKTVTHITYEAQEALASDVFADDAIFQQWSVEEAVDPEETLAYWPQWDAAAYRASFNDTQRIEDNLNALERMSALQGHTAPLSDEDRYALLKYSAWGGLGRLFSPDGSKPHVWSQQRDTVAQLLSTEDYAQVQQHIATAYASTPDVVEMLWSTVQHMGFEGGNILEPGAGVGHLLAGMPAQIAQKSQITAVEADAVCAKMLQLNFAPLGVQVHACTLETAPLPAGFYDLVIGHVPLGDAAQDTSKAPFATWAHEEYVLAKSLDLLRQGGLLVMLIPAQVRERNHDTARQWLVSRGELIASMRVAEQFTDPHGTRGHGPCDVVVFRRREIPMFHGVKPWVQHGDPMPVVLQAMEQVQQCISSMPSGIYQTQAVASGTSSVFNRYSAERLLTPGSTVLHEGRICISEGDSLLDVDEAYTGTARARVLGMLEIKQHALQVLKHQAQSQDDAVLTTLQAGLNDSYDRFVAKLGYLSTLANSRLLKQDPDWPLMLALEVWDEEEGTARKADIFSRRTVGQRQVPATVDNVKDAMMISLSQFGRIEIRDMARRCGQSATQVVSELRAQGLAYKDPEQRAWVSADEYLSGHIGQKIIQARAAGAAYESNVAALLAVLPGDLGPSEVEARLGAHWIAPDIIEMFGAQLVNAQPSEIVVQYDSTSSSWSVRPKSGLPIYFLGERVLQRTRYGTEHRCALELLESALNQTPPTVTKRVDEATVIDKPATIAAREKWQAIRDAFRSWVFQDTARTERLLRVYNDAFNQIVTRKFDGSHLVLPGMTTAVEPYASQKDAIWRILVSGNTLLAHCVGAGKTLILCAASMELRRLGKAHKPLHVVQNSTLEQYTAEFVRLYPQARVLMATKEDLQGDRRRAFVARVATGDWDAVIMTQSTFERIELSAADQQAFLQEQMAQMQWALDHGCSRNTARALRSRIARVEQQLERLSERRVVQDQISFHELGVDFILYDEAHAVKNLERNSKMPRIAGLPHVASQRAWDLFVKSRLIMRGHGGQQTGLVLASATPVSNSLAEIFTFQVFLQPQTLAQLGLLEFDAWSASFGESVTGMEMSPDGSGFRINTRYCRFVNLPELMAIFRQVADIRTKGMLNLPLPQIATGQVQTLVAQPCQDLQHIIADLVERSELIRRGHVDPKVDNMLKITGDGRKAALDVRMIDPSLPANPNGKLALAARNIARIWNQTHELRAAQLVFCDLGTPKSEGFNVYDAVRTELLGHGVPGEQIAFMHDHESDQAKARLFKRVREGDIRILIGSTQRMGTGTNVQRRLVAVHQLDAPWVPADVEQRDGRAHRQGNMCPSIELWRYVTEKSFDAYSWNLLSTKAQFIEQVLTAQAGMRAVEDVTMSALSYAQIKAIASGNPLMLEKATIDARVQKLHLARASWEQERWQLARRESQLIARLAWLDGKMAAVEQDAQHARVELTRAWDFRPSAGVKAVGQRAWVQAQAAAVAPLAGADTALLKLAVAARALSALTLSGTVVDLGELNGFRVVLSKQLETRLYLEGPCSKEQWLLDRPSLHDTSGVAHAVADGVAHALQRPALMRQEYGRVTQELQTAKQMQGSGFEHEDELQDLQQRQRAIESELDLDKGLDGTQGMDQAKA